LAIAKSFFTHSFLNAAAIDRERFLPAMQRLAM